MPVSEMAPDRRDSRSASRGTNYRSGWTPAFACLAVFGVHFQQITHAEGRIGPVDLGHLLENGNRGVCLFLVLTGFLLSLPFWRADNHPATRAISQSGWLKHAHVRNRMARISPAYLPCLAVLVVTE